MTNQEAIEILRGILTEAIEFENSVCYVTGEDREPLEMAIEALENQKTGEWIAEFIPRTQPDNWDRIAIKCSECGVVRTRIMFNADTMDFDEAVKDETTSAKQKNHYCFNCGAKMKGK